MDIVVRVSGKYFSLVLEEVLYKWIIINSNINQFLPSQKKRKRKSINQFLVKKINCMLVCNLISVLEDAF